MFPQFTLNFILLLQLKEVYTLEQCKLKSWSFDLEDHAILVQHSVEELDRRSYRNLECMVAPMIGRGVTPLMWHHWCFHVGSLRL